MYDDVEAVYVAVINYSDRATDYRIEPEDIGLSAYPADVEELWTGERRQNLYVTIPGKDARIYKIKK